LRGLEIRVYYTICAFLSVLYNTYYLPPTTPATGSAGVKTSGTFGLFGLNGFFGALWPEWPNWPWWLIDKRLEIKIREGSPSPANGHPSGGVPDPLPGFAGCVIQPRVCAPVVLTRLRCSLWGGGGGWRKSSETALKSGHIVPKSGRSRWGGQNRATRLFSTA